MIENLGKTDTLAGSTNPVEQSKIWAGLSNKLTKEINRHLSGIVINTLTGNAKEAQFDCMV